VLVKDRDSRVLKLLNLNPKCSIQISTVWQKKGKTLSFFCYTWKERITFSKKSTHRKFEKSLLMMLCSKGTFINDVTHPREGRGQFATSWFKSLTFEWPRGEAWLDKQVLFNNISTRQTSTSRTYKKCLDTKSSCLLDV
jgi:hypothetical protein